MPVQSESESLGPTVGELLAALPTDEPIPPSQVADGRLREIFEQLSQRPVPVGSLERLFAVGGLQAQLALAYLAYFVRSWFQSADKQQQQLMEAHLRSALRTLRMMGYLRGAVMKVGQVLATFPEMLPDEFAELLGTLHFEAPPMHYSLLREYIENELGKDPQDVFKSIEPNAFAAASLGQVHRAYLPSGERVAVKVQYPGIAQTVRVDIANLRRALFPLRLSKDWNSLNAQFGEIQAMLELETNYDDEAQSLSEARAAFHEDEGIVIPRVFKEYSTRRVLTMEYVDGDSFMSFLERNPSQEARNAFGERILRAGLRLYFTRRLLYSDFNPGNILACEDGRFALIDFGGLRRLTDAEWELMRQGHEAMISSDQGEVRDYCQRSLMFSDEEMKTHAHIVELVQDWGEFYWEPLRAHGGFDYGNTQYFRKGMSLWKRAARARILRQQPVNVLLHRCHFELLSLLYRLRAMVDSRRIYEEELPASGWLESNRVEEP